LRLYPLGGEPIREKKGKKNWGKKKKKTRALSLLPLSFSALGKFSTEGKKEKESVWGENRRLPRGAREGKKETWGEKRKKRKKKRRRGEEICAISRGRCSHMTTTTRKQGEGKGRGGKKGERGGRHKQNWNFSSASKSVEREKRGGKTPEREETEGLARDPSRERLGKKRGGKPLSLLLCHCHADCRKREEGGKKKRKKKERKEELKGG